MKYLTELHAHTFPASSCSRISPLQLADAYIRAGYSTLVLTNHLSDHTLSLRGLDYNWEERIDFFIKDFNDLKNAADGRLNIILGAEITLRENSNDYLVYGIDESFLRENPSLFDMKVKELANLVRKKEYLIYQAHPFRNRMTVVNPKILDGIEVYNGHGEHDSRNDIAYMWAEKYNLKAISGTDYHYPEHTAGAGILTETPIVNSEDLLCVLKKGEYTLVRDGAAPK